MKVLDYGVGVTYNNYTKDKNVRYVCVPLGRVNP